MKKENKKELAQGDEKMLYYFENGLMVFTEQYHLKRGFCCGNKCRHCPFDYKNVKK